MLPLGTGFHTKPACQFQKLDLSLSLVAGLTPWFFAVVSKLSKRAPILTCHCSFRSMVSNAYIALVVPTVFSGAYFRVILPFHGSCGLGFSRPVQ